MSQARVKRPIVGGIYTARDDTHVYGFSGSFSADIHAPATYTMFDFVTPLQDYLVDLYYSMALPDNIIEGGLGLQVDIQDETVFKWQSTTPYEKGVFHTKMLWPGGQSVKVFSLNTNENNAQERQSHFVGVALPDILGQDTDRAVGGGYNWSGSQSGSNAPPINMKDLYVASNYLYGGI